ncbi:MAG: DUF2971 domain-containing protein [Pyrinomonadaceae bacterium]
MFEPQKYTYHYTRADTLADKILPSMTLRMSSLQGVNDPREAKTWPFKFYSRSQAGNQLFTPALFDEATKYITQRSLVFCCSRDDPSLDKNDDTRIIRSGYGHPRMWAQYADNHRGICLVLDLERLHESIVSKFGADNLFFGSVEYLNTIHGPTSHLSRGGYDLVYLEDYVNYGLAKVMESHIRLFQKELFFTKHQDWQDEWEYRWVLRSQSGVPVYIPIHDCLHAVILGHDCPTDMTDRVIELCRISNTPVHRMLWHGWTFSILPNQLNEDFHQGPVLFFDGISFSTRIPCGGVFAQGRDQYGKVRPIRIDNNGDVVPMEG